jgi:hypothetical protein
MDFLQKFNYLMSMTKTTNIMLADFLTLDASFVRRMRSGNGDSGRYAQYIRPMASYFAMRCTGKRQLSSLMSAMNITGSSVRNIGKLEDLIFQWLNIRSYDDGEPAGEFLGEPAGIAPKGPAGGNCPDLIPDSTTAGGIDIYYGNDGKRKAVVQLLCEVLKMPSPCTLLLCSQESLSWLTENRDFMATWAALLQQVLMRGNRIKVIHYLIRKPGEIMTAINQWLPIYMSGMVEPFYNPGIGDTFTQQTLFIATGCAVFRSTSVLGRTEKAANFIIRDEKAVDAAISEFNDQLSFCQPLLQIICADNFTVGKNALRDFERAESNVIVSTNSLADLPIPNEVFEQMTRGLEEEQSKRLLVLNAARQKSFEDRLSKNSYHVIINSPDCKICNKGIRPLIYTDLLGRSELFYTPDTIRLQLEYMSSLMKSYENFHVYLVDGKDRREDLIYVKQNIGVMVATTKQPVCYLLNESNMTSAFWKYMLGVMDQYDKNSEEKKQSIRKLDAFIKQW